MTRVTPSGSEPDLPGYYLVDINESIYETIIKTFPNDIDIEIIGSLINNTRIDVIKGCWLRGRDWSHYSQIKTFNLDGTSKTEQAHRVSYKLYSGKVAKEVCHHCDRRGCWNPLHLFGGSHSDNMNDARSKYRVFSVSPAEPSRKQLLKNRLEKIKSVLIKSD